MTRARGGHLLDQVGESYHLIALCPTHHKMSDGGDAYMADLLIDGYVIPDKRTGKPVYVGTDEYLGEKYGNRLISR